MPSSDAAWVPTTVSGAGTREMDVGAMYAPVAVSAGGRVATVTGNDSGSAMVVVDGATVLDATPGVNDVAWSPDGRWLGVLDVNGRLVVVDATGGRQPVAVELGRRGNVQAYDLTIVARSPA